MGHGTRIYGHFIVELLVADRFLAASGMADAVFLISAGTPAWLRKILGTHFGLTADRLVEIDSTTERLRLSKAILPEYPYSGACRAFDPGAANLISGLRDRLCDGSRLDPQKVFITRWFFQGWAGRWKCTNEQDLLAVASRDFGYTIVTPETLSWRNQVLLFSAASHVLGEFGSGLHNAIFSSPGTRIGAIGVANWMQSAIGGLCRHDQAYLDASTKGEFTIDLKKFRAFLTAFEA